uniref:Uncharacterized protein n=1 Tax=Cacopsylla melanoneura TaxID=428564 RepID=A0A8D9FBM7_9HEMI
MCLTTSALSGESQPASMRASRRMPWNVVFFRNTDMPSGELFDKSNFPTSKNRPALARQRTVANSISPANELSTRSTPRPSVSRRMCCSKLVSRELAKFLSVSCGNFFFKKSLLSLDPTVVYTVHPKCKAIEMAACPRPPAPA